VIYRWLKVPENRHRLHGWIDHQERRPVVGPLFRAARHAWRRVRGPVQFFWNRITPGQLGLELTTLLAVTIVGVFNLVGPLLTLRDEPFVEGDLRAFDIVRRLRHDWLNDVAEVVTAFGTLPVAGGAVLLVALVLLVRRQFVEGAVLLAGMNLTVLVVDVVRDHEDRARPLGSFVDTGTVSSYPSAHAAYAVAFVAIAIAVSRALPGIVSRAALITITIVLAAAIALTRVYLRAHYLSDVLAGLGTGMASFALCGMAGLVVAFLRQNAGRT